MTDDTGKAKAVADLDQAFAALLEITRHTGRAYQEMVKEGVPPEAALSLVAEIIRAMVPRSEP